MQVEAHSSLAAQVDFGSGDGLRDAFHGGIDAVINCAAISQPALCEKDPVLARYSIDSPCIPAASSHLEFIRSGWIFVPVVVANRFGRR
jgi:hypothetical protein